MPQRLTNKQILLGITGGIAAYKSAELVRALTAAGAVVRVVMTANAKNFITPMTLQALSGNAVHSELLDSEAEAAMGHIELARWADRVLIAPASASFLSRLNSGQSSDLLSTLCLATVAPIALAPAMNQAMWKDQSTQHNITSLLKKDIHIWGPAEGEQACGDTGPGRMLEPRDLVLRVADSFERNMLDGKHVIITAGPTREAIDPVRFISNHSSGKMGFALAQAASEAGAKVTLIAGPVDLKTPERCERINVISANDMLDAVTPLIKSCDIFIGAAAVADYRPGNISTEKIKKNNDTMTIEMEKTPDIISIVASSADKPVTIGFAAETQNVLAFGKDKLKRKKLDMIACNDVSDKTIGFNSENNTITLIGSRTSINIGPANKHQVAREMIITIAKEFFS